MSASPNARPESHGMPCEQHVEERRAPPRTARALPPRRAGTRSTASRSRRSGRRAAARPRARRGRPARAAARGSARSGTRAITADSGSTQPSSSSTGTLPTGFFSYSQAGRSAQVDLDRVVRDALLGEHDPHPRAVRAAGGVEERERRPRSSPGSRASPSRARRPRARSRPRSPRGAPARGGSSAGRRGRAGDRADAGRVGAGQPRDDARVRGERDHVAGRQRPVVLGHREVLVDDAAGLEAGRSGRPASCSTPSASTTAPVRSESSVASRRSIDGSRSQTSS